MSLRAIIASATVLAALSVSPLQAQDRPGETPETDAAAAPLPEPVVTRHEAVLDDERLGYEARVETLELTDRAGEPTAHLFVVAYLADRGEEERPVTFLMNGGPGAASAYLHVGGVGPWTIDVDALGRPVDSRELVANPETWLAFTDLVFLDPVGTGFSRAVEPGDERFYNHDADLESLVEAIDLWLDARGRRTSPVYIAGESYGGYRAAALPERLMHEQGIQLAGTILVSPLLDSSTIDHTPAHPMSWAFLLPSYAATAAGHDRATAADPVALRDFALGDYLSGLVHPDRMGALLPRLAELTGLDEAFLRERRGRVQPNEFRRRLLADRNLLVSAYDGLLSVPDPTPSRTAARVDPILDGMTPAFVTGFLDHLRRRLEWREGRAYDLLSREVNRAWSFGEGDISALEELQEVMALSPDFRVFVAHGETDLVTPWLASEWLLGQVDDALGGTGDRIVSERYPGGHMFYMRPDANASLSADLARFFAPAQAR